MLVLRLSANLLLATIGFCQGPASVLQIAYPGSPTTNPLGLNNSNQIVGWFNPNDGHAHGFLRNADGTYAQFMCPAGPYPYSIDTYPYAINNLGVIAGACPFAAPAGYGFIRDAMGNFTRVDAPVTSGTPQTTITGINDSGQVTGYYTTVTEGHAFVRDAAGNFTSFDVPGASGTLPRSIDNSGQITGSYHISQINGSNPYRGFVRDTNGGFTTFDLPLGSNDNDWKRNTDGTIVPLAIPTSDANVFAAVNDSGVMIGTDQTTLQGLLAIPCASATLDVNGRQHGPGNEIGTVSVVVPAGCSWTAVSYAKWITHPSGAVTGSGTQTYVVLPNQSGAPRSGQLNIAGQIFTVSQAAGSCTYMLSGPATTSPFGGMGVIGITTSPGCGWVAVAAQALPSGSWQSIPWLTTSPNSGSSSGSTVYTAAKCPTLRTCSGTILIGDQVFTVTETGNYTVFVEDDTTRAVTAWYTDSSFSTVASATLSGPEPGWHLAATGDFDGNGVTDLIWQNDSNGQATVWFMGPSPSGGVRLVSWYPLGDGGSDWRVVAATETGSFRIWWQNQQTGEATSWDMTLVGGAPALVSWSYVSGPQPGWRIVGEFTSHYNSEGVIIYRESLYWQNQTSGMVTVGGIVVTPGFGSDWKVVGADAFGLLWQNESTRQVTYWDLSVLGNYTLSRWGYLFLGSTPGAHVVAR